MQSLPDGSMPTPSIEHAALKHSVDKLNRTTESIGLISELHIGSLISGGDLQTPVLGTQNPKQKPNTKWNVCKH